MVMTSRLDYNVIVFPGLILVLAIQQYCSLYLVASGPGYIHLMPTTKAVQVANDGKLVFPDKYWLY
jgi:hypothetical protein